MKPLATAPVPAFRPDGSLMDLGRPRVSEVDFRAMAGRLSRLARFGGLPFAGSYSVAQHCVHGADAMLREGAGEMLAALFLLHDAHEAFLGDVTRSTQDLIASVLAEKHGSLAAAQFVESLADIKAAWDGVIYEAAGLPAPNAWKRSWFAVVDTVDQRLALTEARELLGEEAAKWSGFRRGLNRPQISGTIKPWPAVKAEFAFLEMLEKLIGRDRVAASVATERTFRPFDPANTSTGRKAR